MPGNTEFQVRQPSGPVRVTIPAAVAYDLPSLQKGIASIVGRLGCGACCSGFDITFQQEREFVINEKLEISPVARFSADPALQSALGSGFAASAVRVTLPAKVSYDINQIQQAVAEVAGRLGHSQCCSGFDFTFMHERELLFDEALNVRTR